MKGIIKLISSTGILKQLVIEYDFDQGKFAGQSLRQLPIQNSQWQYILDNNIVDTEVEFQFINKCQTISKKEECGCDKICIQLAQITIPRELLVNNAKLQSELEQAKELLKELKQNLIYIDKESMNIGCEDEIKKIEEFLNQ